jgi:NADH:ubiquinone oxidoreductase subunit 5 (subunit L)/multisubunit Na+/H+ antiporter MnhA subunit
MKKIATSLMMLGVPFMAFADGEVLGDAQQATTEAAGLFGSAVILVLLALWVVPIIIGFMVYNSKKKKAEQAHEDMGLATAGMVLSVIVVSYAAVFFFEGAVGKAMSDDPTSVSYSKGVGKIISPVLESSMDKVTGKK